jgi:ribosome-associated protein
MTDPVAVVRTAVGAALDKKASDPVVMDMRGVSSFTDFFMVCSADSEPQLKAIASAVREALREGFGLKPLAEDGYPASQWIVLDYGTLICHLFLGAKRGFYDLEGLWSDAPRLAIEGT